MPAERNAFKLGLSLIIFFVLFLGVLWFLAPAGGGDLNVRVRFPHEDFDTTLNSGSVVTCGGQVVGRVNKIRLKEMMNEQTGYEHLYVLVDFEVEESVGLRKDADIEPSALLLGGQGRLAIRDRGMGKPVQGGDLIDGQVRPDLEELTARLAEQLDPDEPASLLALIQSQLDPDQADSIVGKTLAILEDFHAVSGRIRSELDPDQQTAFITQVHHILDKVNDMSAELRDELSAETGGSVMCKTHDVLDAINTSLATARGMLEENRVPINETIESVRDTSRILQQQVARQIAEQLNPDNMAGLLAKLHVAIDRAERSLKNINAITENTEEVVTLNEARINEMLNNFEATSQHLKAASREIRQSPWRLFYQPDMEELQRANLSRMVRTFSEAASELDDAVTRLQSLTQAADGKIPVDDKTLNEIIEHLKNTFDRFSEVEEKFWNQLEVE
jgi:ABC-type transporter Mla subunit MlaD